MTIELAKEKRAGRIPKMGDRLVSQIAGIDALYTRWVEVGRNVGLMTARTGRLRELYDAEVLAKAVADVLALTECIMTTSRAVRLRCSSARRRASEGAGVKRSNKRTSAFHLRTAK